MATETTTRDSWALGFAVFAGIAMATIGIFQVIQGLVAIITNEFFVLTPKYAFRFDVTAWGWIHLVMGIVVGLAGWAIFAGLTWARVVGIVVVALNAVANFLYIPHYPFWSLLIIALDVVVIWALAVYMRPYQST
ncbi:MAG TPA: hypothetical protein VH912_14915 [Streptosporangiaceae bacterium]